MRRYITLALLLGCAIGLATGVGSYTFIYAKGGSYMTNDPAACANCHIMHDQYNGWLKSSHRHVAVCNDCHAPHDFVGKYATKAINGWNHSLAFTTGNFHEPIRINEMNRKITEDACRSCHGPIVEQIDHPHYSRAGVTKASDWSETSCIRCHDSVGHM